MRLSRAPATICLDIKRNSEVDGYRAMPTTAGTFHGQSHCILASPALRQPPLPNARLRRHHFILDLPIKSALNNSLCVPLASHHHVGGNAEVEQSSKNKDTKKPQLPKDHPN
jgi:hypothetical protein